MSRTFSIYCAGGDVFLPESEREAVFDNMRALAQQLSDDNIQFRLLIPIDNEIELLPDTDAASKHRNALCIRLANEAMIARCDALIANLSPFRGNEPDCGTAYECGFARALGKPVLNYTDNCSEQTARYRDFDFGANANDERYAYTEIEDFALPFNPMMYGDDYPVFTDFESALRYFAKQQKG